jgi:hypothetical protein
MDQEQLNKMIEKELRFVIGDLHVQLIIMKQMLEMAKQGPGLDLPGQEIRPNGRDVHG